MSVTFIATGADFVSNAGTAFNTTGPGQDGDFRLTGGTKPFPDDYIIAFTASGEDSNGELGQGSGFSGIKVYASQAAYEAGTVLHHYTPQNLGQVGATQADGSGTGDCYISFNAIFVNYDGGPALQGRLWVSPGSDAANQIGSYETRRFENTDFDGSGTIDPGTTEVGNGKFDGAKSDSLFVCFTTGTRIATLRGEMPVDCLMAGDKVITRDNGLQEIRWVGARRVSRASLAQSADMAPVHISAGALGNGLPERDMVLSPNHRMLLVSPDAELMFDESEVLVAAKHLVGWPGVRRVYGRGVQYHHILFDRHEVILADGSWSESFQPGDYSMAGVGAQTRAEIVAVFPELAEPTGLQGYLAARRALRGHEAGMLPR